MLVFAEVSDETEEIIHMRYSHQVSIDDVMADFRLFLLACGFCESNVNEYIEAR